MNKPHCDICDCLIKTGAVSGSVHFCARCRPFAEDFLKQRTKEFESAMAVVQKTMERFRAKYVNDVVVPGTQAKPKLEAVE